MADINPVIAAIKAYGDARAAEALAPPVPPAATVKVTASVTSTGTILAKWVANDSVSGFTVQRNDPIWKQAVSGTTRQFEFSNFTEGKTYQIGVAIGTAAPTLVNVAYKLPVAPPVTPTGDAPQLFPTKPIALYHMCWANSGSPKVSTTPANVNVLFLAFAQGDPPSMVGNASDGSAFGSELKKLRARGVRIILSVGGAGGSINVSNRDAFVNGVLAISTSLCPLDGLDWDLEGAAMSQADVLYVCAQLKAKRGKDFAITMAPNGSNVGQYLPIAKALYDAGNLSGFGQQFYDAEVSQGAMMGRIDEFVSKGIPVSKYLVGTMVGDANTYWTVDECVSNVKAARVKYPALAGAYLWEASRAGTADWASRVGAIVKG